MTKSTITRERLQEIAEDGFLKHGESKELARIALAAMDSEPVAEVLSNRPGNDTSTIDRALPVGTQIYRHAQPATVVPTFDEWLEIRGSKPLGWVKDAMRESYDASRAAMLQAGTLTNEDTKQAWTGIPDIDNAINMLDRIDTLESCDDDRIEAVKTVLRRLAGNSPVIPDGLIAAVNRLLDSDGSRSCYSAIQCGDAHDEIERMLAAAPQDTPALNSVQSVVTVPGKWIPVSERMPEDDDFVYIWPRPDFGVELHVGQYCECSPKGDGWYAQVYEQNYGIEWHPITVTHWMPLPAGPKEVKGE